MKEKKRIVIKVGTSTLTHESGSLNLQRIERMARVLADLHGMGHEVILVSSGAIAVGVAELQMGARPTELRYKQAAAAVGQCNIMHIYDKLFSEYTCSVAQILLTGDDVDDPLRAEHLSNTFSALLEMGVIPIVNENDSVSSAEIETGHNKILGDNDTLSAIVAKLCKADLLVLLSDIDGLFDADPHSNPDAKLIRDITYRETIERGLKVMDTSAFQMCLDQHIPCIRIFNMDDLNNILRVAQGEPIGTVVHL